MCDNSDIVTYNSRKYLKNLNEYVKRTTIYYFESSGIPYKTIKPIDMNMMIVFIVALKNLFF